MKYCLECGDLDSAVKMVKMFPEREIKNTNFQYALNILEILLAEKKEGVSVGFVDSLNGWEEMKRKYDEVKFLLRHVEQGEDTTKAELVREIIANGILSKSSIVSITNHSVLAPSDVKRKIMPELY